MELFTITRRNWRPFLAFGMAELGHLLRERIGRRPPRTERALRHVKAVAPAGNPAAVLAAMDGFARGEQFLMNVGEKKGRLLESVVNGARGGRILELGSYCGYSAVLIARLLEGDGHLTCVEKDPRCAAIAREVVAHAGLAARVDVRTGAAAAVIPTLEAPFDVVFIDHVKELYLADLERIEARGLLRPGAVVVADNTGIFARQLRGYLRHVRDSGRYRSESHRTRMEYQDRIPDAVEVSVLLSAPART